MSKRRLKRQLNLLQVIMLGTAGTIAAEIFVLTGHVAGMVGPAAVLALAIVGLLCYSLALNYCELGTTYPETGGALTYVREAWGSNLLSFLVGSLDCLSSTFYAALSAVGFAYSLRVFIPILPIVPTAIVVVLVFVALNILGVNQVGRAQIVLGGLLLCLLAAYIVAGLTLPGGFRWDVLLPEGSPFIHQDGWANVSRLIATMALIFNAYIGFEVIADDAEEVSNPSRNIPRGILISLTVVTATYVLVALVTLGTIPWQELAGSETALTDAARRFLPRIGAPMMALAGIIATLTSVNTAMLSATREAFTMSRDGAWPRFMSRLGRLRTPYAAILVIGAIVCLVAAIGLVDFLSYISSSGYLFVLFWANLAMLRLRRRYTEIKRPFRVPLYPLTVVAAAGTCVVIVVFTEFRALLFGLGVLATCTAFYFLRGPLSRWAATRIRTGTTEHSTILVPVANPRTAESLVRLTARLAGVGQNAEICLLTVAPLLGRLRQQLDSRWVARLAARQRSLLRQATDVPVAAYVPIYAKMRTSSSVAQGILEEINTRGDVRMVVMGWPGALQGSELATNAVKLVLQRAPTHVAVLLDRGLAPGRPDGSPANGAQHLGLRRILVPVGGGPHSRLALRLAYELAEPEHAELVALHALRSAWELAEIEDEMAGLREVVETELGHVPERLTTRVAQSPSIVDGILAEMARQHYDLLVVGASEQWCETGCLFGAVDDALADRAPCSVLLVRRHEPTTLAWLRRQAKRMERD